MKLMKSLGAQGLPACQGFPWLTWRHSLSDTSVSLGLVSASACSLDPSANAIVACPLAFAFAAFCLAFLAAFFSAAVFAAAFAFGEPLRGEAAGVAYRPLLPFEPLLPLLPLDPDLVL